MKQRGFWNVFSRTAIFFGLYMGVVNLAYFLAYTREPIYPWYVAVILVSSGSILLGFIMAFKFEPKAISVPFKKKEDLADKIKAAMTTHQFEQLPGRENPWVYKSRKFFLHSVIGTLSVEWEPASAKITGPKLYIDKLEKEFEHV